MSPLSIFAGKNGRTNENASRYCMNGYKRKKCVGLYVARIVRGSRPRTMARMSVMIKLVCKSNRPAESPALSFLRARIVQSATREAIETSNNTGAGLGCTVSSTDFIKAFVLVSGSTVNAFSGGAHGGMAL